MLSPKAAIKTVRFRNGLAFSTPQLAIDPSSSRRRTLERVPKPKVNSLSYIQQPRFLTAALIFIFIACWALQPTALAQVSAPDFTIVVFPDPQNETQFFPQVLNSQLQWIVNNRQS